MNDHIRQMTLITVRLECKNTEKLRPKHLLYIPSAFRVPHFALRRLARNYKLILILSVHLSCNEDDKRASVFLFPHVSVCLYKPHTCVRDLGGS